MDDVVNTGMIEMAIGHESGFVVQRFKEPMIEVRMEPQNAIDIACAITDHAFEAKEGMKPLSSTLKAELVERHRMKLTKRIALMMPQLRKMTDGKAAQTMVEAVLKEVF